MYRICLMNLPFAALYFPSIALTQLKSVSEERFKERVTIEIAYGNHDFARFIGVELFSMISNSLDAHSTGIGDWLFRQIAFPDLDENHEAYFRRYFPRNDPGSLKVKEKILEIRSRLPEFFAHMVEKYDLNNVNLLGLTSMFTQNIACFAMAEVVKRTNPGVVTIMGGANCEAPMGTEIAKNVKQIDFVFSGPALISFPEFLQHQLDQEYSKCHNIKGVFSRRNSMLSVLDSKGEIGEELPIDVEIKLEYESFLKEMRTSFPKKELAPILLFETSRGCWWGEKAHCTFCGLNGGTMSYRAMQADKALAQFDNLFKYSDECSRFDAVDNILPRNYLTDVLPHLTTPPGAQIFYEVKADLSEEQMQTLARAGVRSIQPGIESLATTTLKLMRKGTSAFTNLLLLKNCISYCIFPYWNLLVAFPGERETVYQKYAKDLPLLAHLPPPSGAFPVRFDRYSPYFVRAKEYELDLHPLPYYGLTYPFSDESLRKVAYYFADSNLKATYFVEMAKWIGTLKGLVEAWKAKWSPDKLSQRPKLYFTEKDGNPAIYDSRFDEPVEHQISATDVRLLKLLNKPGRPRDVGNKLQLSAGEAETRFGALQEMGMIFQEDDRYLSLVINGEPKASGWLVDDYS